jgi:LPS O-antigen subunit length determinant protein (WzzB/FepE family)
VWKLEEKVYDEKEIDLIALFRILWNEKIFIIVFTLFFVFLASIYVSLKTPVYEVKMIIEIGSYNNGKNYIENPQNLIKKLQVIYIDNMKNKIENKIKLRNVSLVKGTDNIIELIVTGVSNEEAIKFLNKIMESLKNEHNIIINRYKSLINTNVQNLQFQKELLEKEENKFEGSAATKFELQSKINDLELLISPHSIQNTNEIGEVILNMSPIEPKKALILIVTFVSTFILAIFLVFFMQLIRGFKLK